MKRLILALACTAMSLPLTACDSGLLASAPAPLAQTAIDDIGLEKTWQAFELALDAINVLGDMGKIVPGSPNGKAIAQAIRVVNAALKTAEIIAHPLNNAAPDYAAYAAALRDASNGMREISTLLRSK